MPIDVPAAAALLGIGVAAGFLAGLLGIGGGVLLVPAMVLLLNFDQHVAQGTSLLVIIPAAAAGSWTHHRHGRLKLRDAASVAAGGVIGAAVGSLFALGIDDELLRRLFAAILIVSAARMVWPKRASVPDAADEGTPE